jgi:heme exporter protein B
MGRSTGAIERGRVVSDVTEEATTRSDWMAQTLALVRKDARAELRTKTAISSVGIFTFAALLLLTLATASLKGVTVPTPDGSGDRPVWADTDKMALLWVLFCFAAFAGLSHSFVHEEQAGTVTALRLSMLPEAVYAGKLLFNLAVLLGVIVVTTPIYMAVTGMGVGSPAVFVAMMLSGCLGLAGTATVVAALTAKARGTGALYGALGLPILIVFLLMLLNAARTVYVVNAPAIRIVKDIGGLLSFGVLLVTLSAMLFHFIWED